MTSHLSLKTYAPPPPKDTVKLAISFCSNRPMPPRCAIAMMALIHHLTIFGVQWSLIVRIQASVLPQAREDCLREAKEDSCTHQLWWDDDIEPPADAPLRMLQAMGQHPHIDIIAANYCRKQDTLQYTAEDVNGDMMESAGKIGLQEASNIGLGLALIKLEKMYPLKGPHFAMEWNEEHQAYQGEDRYFTKKIRAAGLRIFVDHGISNYTQHWGDFPYNFSVWKNNTPKMGKALETLRQDIKI